MSEELHTCVIGPVCPDEVDMGTNSAGQRVIVDQGNCEHGSCKTIQYDSAAGCNICFTKAIRVEEEIQEILGSWEA